MPLAFVSQSTPNTWLLALLGQPHVGLQVYSQFCKVEKDHVLLCGHVGRSEMSCTVRKWTLGWPSAKPVWSFFPLKLLWADGSFSLSRPSWLLHNNLWFWDFSQLRPMAAFSLRWPWLSAVTGPGCQGYLSTACFMVRHENHSPKNLSRCRTQVRASRGPHSKSCMGARQGASLN